MREAVIAKEVAEQMVADWADFLDVEAPPAGHIIRAICSGRLDCDGGLFRYRFISPLTLANGQTLAEITIREPTGRQLRETSRGNRDEMDTTLRLIESLSGQPLGVIESIGMRDLTVLGELLGFFA